MFLFSDNHFCMFSVLIFIFGKHWCLFWAIINFVIVDSTMFLCPHNQVHTSFWYYYEVIACRSSDPSWLCKFPPCKVVFTLSDVKIHQNQGCPISVLRTKSFCFLSSNIYFWEVINLPVHVIYWFLQSFISYLFSAINDSVVIIIDVCFY